jgi:hypothetical protein
VVELICGAIPKIAMQDWTDTLNANQVLVAASTITK